MSSKSELFQVRVDSDLADRIEEIVESVRESEPSKDLKPEEPDVHRRIVREGVDVLEGGETDLRRLREYREKVENPTAGDWLDITLSSPLAVLGPLAGAIITFLGALSLGITVIVTNGAGVPIIAEIALYVIFIGVLVGVGSIVVAFFQRISLE